MTTETSITNSNISKADLNPGFLVIAIGGAGKESVKSAKKHYQAAGRPFAMYTVAIDTDPRDFDAFDLAINISPTRQKLSAMDANPEKYGPACKALVKYHRSLLKSEAIGHGSRMTRIITQVAFELFHEQIINDLRHAIHSLIEQGQPRILPVVIASFGGGMGSAGLLLLQDFFTDDVIKRKITFGLQYDMVARAVLFAIDGFAHANQQRNEANRRRILANIYSTRVELAEYEKADKGYQYCFHLGLGNDAGAIFPTIEQVCEANGVICCEWMANYDIFKSHAVNDLDFCIDTTPYNGDDIPELHGYPRELIPEYGERIDEVTTEEELIDEKTDDKDETDTKSTELDGKKE